MENTVGAVAALLPGVRIEPVETLRRTERSEVLRVRAVRPGWSGAQMLIVKAFPDAGEGWVRESATLAAAPDGAPVPRLVAASADPPVVVMTDAGTGPSVADVLLGDDAAEARTAVGRLAAALAGLHLSTRGARDAFGAELAARSGGTVHESAMPRFAAGAASALAGLCDQLGVRVPEGALPELADLPERLSVAGPAALTLADACPDNNVRAGDGYLLIDFEEAEWRHIAWDVAYLTVPWPSCWCSFLLPADVTQQALARYRARIAGRLPYVDTPAFGHDVALATTGWEFVSGVLVSPGGAVRGPAAGRHDRGPANAPGGDPAPAWQCAERRAAASARRARRTVANGAGAALGRGTARARAGVPSPRPAPTAG